MDRIVKIYIFFRSFFYHRSFNHYRVKYRYGNYIKKGFNMNNLPSKNNTCKYKTEHGVLNIFSISILCVLIIGISTQVKALEAIPDDRLDDITGYQSAQNPTISQHVSH